MLIRALALAVALVPATALADAPLRIVEVTFTKGAEVIAQPRAMVGGIGGCQTYTRGLQGEPPTVKVEYCALQEDRLRVRWKVILGSRVVSHQTIGSYAPGTVFDASVQGVLDVRVVVEKPE